MNKELAPITQKITAVLKKSRCHKHITSLALFGSTVSGATHAESDIDLLIDYDHSQKFSLLDLIHFKHELEDAFGKKFDVVTRDGLSHLLKDRIIKSSAVFYERK